MGGVQAHGRGALFAFLVVLGVSWAELVSYISLAHAAFTLEGLLLATGPPGADQLASQRADSAGLVCAELIRARRLARVSFKEGHI